MICFDNRIMDDFRHIHRYYAAVKLAKYLGKNDSIVTNGNELLLEELAKNDDLQTEFRFSNEISDFDGYAIVSDRLCENRKIEDISALISSKQNRGWIIFLNEEQLHIYFDGTDKKVFSKIRPIFIEIKETEKSHQEVIYLYSENKKLLKRLKISV